MKEVTGRKMAAGLRLLLISARVLKPWSTKRVSRFFATGVDMVGWG